MKLSEVVQESFQKSLQESFFQSVTSPHGPVDVYVNPSNIELKHITRSFQTKETRRVFGSMLLPFIVLGDGGVLFWTPFALHHNIYRHFEGWGLDPKDFIPCYGDVEGDELHVEISDSYAHTAHAETFSPKDAILNNPYLKEHFHIDPAVGHYNGDNTEDTK